MNPGSGETSHGQMAQILTPNHHGAAADGAVSRLKQEGHLVVYPHTPLWQVVFMFMFFFACFFLHPASQSFCQIFICKLKYEQSSVVTAYFRTIFRTIQDHFNSFFF